MTITLTSAGYVSIAELVIYLPSLFAAAVVTSRHGFRRSSGWIYTLILCVIRIAGAGCQLATYNDHSTGLLTTTAILDLVGISPLLFATLGIMSRFVGFVNARGNRIFSTVYFRVIQLCITAALILSITGGTNSFKNGTYSVQATSKVGIAVYLVAFLGISWILLRSFGYRAAVPATETRSLFAVSLAWPLIAVRLAYAVLSTFVNDPTFSSFGGSVAVRVGMAVVEEYLVVIDYIILGFNLKVLTPEERGEIAHGSSKARRRGDGGEEGYQAIVSHGGR
ncbi:hypothetical protein NLU13_3751 [Sarocladium strictum]|uniref:DUF7702 domain-containing protein n=1 Tax=Sarocladium strictum TaxID=5046 RepID=A0AA39L6I5_SARSR|nr:hypothetical protein NLU13_7112 [Sarocladium strictum]KAK0390179.1 hypothetical protein NLU13_3751 [Sarocladium strictum]